MIPFNAIILNLAGNTGVAAYGVVANISLVIVAVYTGIAQGIQPLVTTFYGMGNNRQARNVRDTTFCVGASLLNPAKPFMDLWYRVNKKFSNYKLHLVPFEDDHKGILSEIAQLGEKFDFLLAVCDSKLWLDKCNMLPLGRYRKRPLDLRMLERRSSRSRHDSGRLGVLLSHTI